MADAAAETWLVGDVGGTNARFGLVARDGKLLHSAVLADADYAQFIDAIRTYLGQRGDLPTRLDHAAIKHSRTCARSRSRKLGR